MTAITIPDWDPQGVLPPFDPARPTSPERSPYRVSLAALVARFATSVERVAILRGLLDYRAALHRLGLVSGFQWLDGSFTEDVERVEGRVPRDVDVVTFVLSPNGAPGGTLDGDEDALDHDAAKRRFSVDGYFVELDLLPPRDLTAQTAYWYSLWSHRRTRIWKGFVEVELDPRDDDAARAALVDATGAPEGEEP
jgi:hypothetical protein